MNLTEPPEVEDLTPDRTEQLRAALVARAARDTRRRTPHVFRRAWVPMLAAGAGVATVVAAGVLVLPGPGRDSAEPATSPTPTHTPSATVRFTTRPTPVVTNWTAPASARLTLDQGPATDTEIRNALRRCFSNPGEDRAFEPDDADTAIIEWARWMLKPVTITYPDETYDPTPRRQLAVSALRADRKAVATCVDDPTRVLGDHDGMTWSSLGKNDRRGPLPAASRVPITGGGSDGNGRTRDGRWVLSYVEDFQVVARAARVEIRYSWPGGAGPWYVATVHNGFGYAVAAATGDGTAPVPRRVDFRLYDAAGRLFYQASQPSG